MWNETNPTSLYLGTTWELISSGKYIQTGNTALTTGGNNSITISKDNLPNIKLNTTSATATIQDHFHFVAKSGTSKDEELTNGDTISKDHMKNSYNSYRLSRTNSIERADVGKTSDSGGGTTGSFTLQTETMGNGTPLNIQPSYITLKFWKRTS